MQVSFTLELGEHALKRLHEIAEIAGNSPEEILQTFIADLTKAELNQGSDERLFAERWALRGAVTVPSVEAYQALTEYLNSLVEPGTGYKFKSERDFHSSAEG